MTPRPNQSWGLAIANSQEEAIRGHQERTTPAPSNPLTFPPIQTPQPQQLSTSTVVDLTHSPPAAEPELEPEQELEPEPEELVAEPEQRSRTHSSQSHHPQSESAMSTNTNGSSGERGSKPEDFTGERSKSRRWLALFNNYLRLNKTRYTTEEDKVSLFLSFFKGDIGGRWAEARLTEYDNDQDDEDIAEGNKRWTTLKSVTKRFKDDFRPMAYDVAA